MRSRPPRRRRRTLRSSLPAPPSSTLFPYTTLFRSHDPLLVGLLERVEARPRGQHDPALHRRVRGEGDRKSTRLNSSHITKSYGVFCLKKKKINSSTGTGCNRDRTTRATARRFR